MSILGYSHNKEYNLYSLGEIASAAVQEFAETGGTSTLETFQSKPPSNNGTKNGTIAKSNQHLVFDGFTSPPIDAGVGTSEGNLFLDGDHSMVIR